jgi:hypothetical protein
MIQEYNNQQLANVEKDTLKRIKHLALIAQSLIAKIVHKDKIHAFNVLLDII